MLEMGRTRENAFETDAEDTVGRDVENGGKIVTGNDVIHEEWLISLANIWIVASMALIHRVACVGIHGHAPQAKLGKPERIEDKRRTDHCSCLHAISPASNHSMHIQEFRY